MEKYYLFVHFRETRFPEGEQVYFALSKGGFVWDSLNGGKPVLSSNIGEKGVRDFTITRTAENNFVILATDLSLANRVNNKYGSWDRIDWPDITKTGSDSLIKWTSDDLVNWTKPESIRMVDQDFGCVWAPDIIYDDELKKYLVHWSSPHRNEEYQKKKIFCSLTEDFENFTKPEILYEHNKNEVIDSCTYKSDGKYYCFVKLEGNGGIRLLESERSNGGYQINDAFHKSSPEFTSGQFEAPTIFQLPDQRWCLLLDFYGTKDKDGHGYVPFVSEDISRGIFKRADDFFSFPYGFKHGTVLEITFMEYERLMNRFKKS